MADAAVRETDNDAAVSRLSAVNAGYLQDPFAGCFVKRPQTRPPLINIGTFLRTWAIDKLVSQFLNAGSPDQKKQIVSLGAGTDTRFFRIMAADGQSTDSAAGTSTTSTGSRLSPASLHKYVEVDFPEATTKKAMTIRRQAKLSSLLGEDVKIEQGGTALVSSKYALLPGDLRDFEGSVASQLQQLLDPSLPTLLLAECVFIYIETQHSNGVLSWFTETFKQPGCTSILYDPVGLDDAFGRVMITNLKSRSLTLHGLPASSSLSVQTDRLQKCGFQHAFARTVREIRKADVPASETERISKLEFLDEIEELDLLLSHYSVAWAYSQPVTGEVFDGINLSS